MLAARDPDVQKQLDKKAFAEAMDISPHALNAYITTLKTQSAKRDELKALGYSEKQIPGWVGSAAKSERKEVSASNESGTSVASVASNASLVSNAVTPDKRASIGGSQRDASDANEAQNTNAPLNTSASEDDDVLEQINKRLGPGGEHFESFGSDALQRWDERQSGRGVQSRLLAAVSADDR